MLALNKKLWRELWHMKGQAGAICMVLASGVATYVMSLSVLHSLQGTQAAFYRDGRFAEVFASLKRAPESLASRIREIPGVRDVETRVASTATLDIESYPDPVAALIYSIPDSHDPLLNRVYLRRGRMPEPGRDNEVLASEAFANAHGFQPGAILAATIYGRRRRVEITGIVLSPDTIYSLQPGALIPDFKSYGILWMRRKALAAAADMEGAFNDLALTLTRDARQQEVIDRLDELLARYGSLGAYGRKEQMSHRFLSEEFRGLEQMAKMFPVIFLSVAAFLLNVVISRLIATQREQVAILKAFGYTTTAVALHYLKLVVLIVIAGAAAGIGLGVWMGRGMGQMYMTYYRFPFLLYELRPSVVFASVLISSCAALAGCAYAVVRAARISPAEAMQPAPPARYSVSLVERLGLGRFLAQPTRMIIRNIERRPIKALLSVVGIAASAAILVMGFFFGDAIDYMVDLQLRVAQRDDVTVTFVEAAGPSSLYSLGSIPGVQYTEPFRNVPVRMRFEHRSYRTALRGIATGGILYRLLDTRLEAVELPKDGVVLTDYLAKMMGIRPGDFVTLEILEGRRPIRRVRVAGVVSEYIGVFAYMPLESVYRLLGEDTTYSGAYLDIDPPSEKALYTELKGMPRVAGSSTRKKMLTSFYETMANQMLVFAFFNTLLAATIAVGVVYNSARIALSERSRELASLRVLGFTRGEISYILLGEMGLLTIVALVPGCLLGHALSAMMVTGTQNELFRVPIVVSPSTYSFAASVVLAASIGSAIVIRRKLNRLDLVAVLKTKE